MAAVGEEVQEAETADDGKRRSKKHKKHHKKAKRERSSRREPEPAPAVPPQDRRYVAGMHERRTPCSAGLATCCGVVMSHGAAQWCCQCTLLQECFLLA